MLGRRSLRREPSKYIVYREGDGVCGGERLKGVTRLVDVYLSIYSGKIRCAY